MRVLFISPQPFFQWRGSPIRVAFNVQALRELGFDVDLLTLPIGEEKDIPGVRVMRVGNPFRVKNVPIGPSLHKAFFDVLLLSKGLRLARRGGYDVIHGVEEAGAVGVLVAHRGRSRLVYEKHSDPASHRKGGLKDLVLSLYARVERFTARCADAVIGTGEGLVRQVASFAPDTPGYHIPDIPSSLVEATAEGTARVRAELQQHANELLITYVGSFAVYQGVDLLFASIPEVVRRHPEARFIVIGGSPAQIDERRRQLAVDGAEGAVTFVGKVPPDVLPDYLAASDILLSPRLSGVNTPLKLLDYFKAGGAIVATDVEANRLILTEETAILTNPEPSAFAKGICALLSDGERRTALSARGRSLIDETFNFGEFKHRLGECYAALGVEGRVP